MTPNIQLESRKENNLRTENNQQTPVYMDQGFPTIIEGNRTANNHQTPMNIDQGFPTINIDTRTARQKGLDTRRMRNICRKCNQQGHFNKDCPFLTEEERNKVQKPREKGHKSQKEWIRYH